MAQRYTKNHFQPNGLWRIEPGHEIPPGVLISYNVIPPVYPDRLSQEVRTEISRRKEIGHGLGYSARVMWHRGLLVCRGCGWAASTRNSDGRGYIGCTSNRRENTRRCESPAFISERLARRYVTALLSQIIEVGQAALTTPDSAPLDVDGLRQTLASLEDRARKIVRQRLDFADTDIEALYTTELEAIARQIGAQKRRLDEAERQITRVRPPDPAAIEDLKRLTIERFWEMDGDKQNQLLHLIFGDLRLVVDRHAITGLIHKR